MRKRTNALPPAEDLWLASLKAAGRSDSTLDCYARDIRDLVSASGVVEARQLSTLDQCKIDAIAAVWRQDGALEATIVRRFSALRGFATYLVHEQGMNLSALLSANFPTAPKGKRPPVEELKIGLLLSMDVEGWRSARDSAVFAIHADAGLTPTETANLNVGHVDLLDRLVHVVDTHLTPRIVGLSDRSRDLVREYFGALPFSLAETEPLFVTSRRTRLNVRSMQVSFRRRRLRLGVSEEATLMGLRHASAARLANNGGSPDLLASALGVLRSTVLRYFDGEA